MIPEVPQQDRKLRIFCEKIEKDLPKSFVKQREVKLESNEFIEANNKEEFKIEVGQLDKEYPTVTTSKQIRNMRWLLSDYINEAMRMRIKSVPYHPPLKRFNDKSRTKQEKQRS